MRQARKPRHVQGSDEYSGCDAGRFNRVIVFDLAAIAKRAELLQEDGDEIWSSLQERLVRVGAQRLQRLQPFRWCAVLIEFTLLDFRRFTYSFLRPGTADDTEVPWLQIGSARRRTGRLERRLDDVARYRSV